jgi:hypothetical protein
VEGKNREEEEEEEEEEEVGSASMISTEGDEKRRGVDVVVFGTCVERVESSACVTARQAERGTVRAHGLFKKWYYFLYYFKIGVKHPFV